MARRPSCGCRSKRPWFPRRPSGEPRCGGGHLPTPCGGPVPPSARHSLPLLHLLHQLPAPAGRHRDAFCPSALLNLGLPAIALSSRAWEAGFREASKARFVVGPLPEQRKHQKTQKTSRRMCARQHPSRPRNMRPPARLRVTIYGRQQNRAYRKIYATGRSGLSSSGTNPAGRCRHE